MNIDKRDRHIDVEQREITWNTDVLDAIEDRVVQGETVAHIASELGMSSKTLLRRFQVVGRDSPAKIARRKRLTRLDDPTWLRQRYIADSRTIRDIAAELHVGDVPVREALQHHGIEREPPDNAIIAGFSAGMSIRAITRKLGVDRDVVRRVLRSNGLHDGAPRKGPAALVDAPTLRRWHLTEKMSAPEIAKRLGVSNSSAKRALHRHQIPIQGYRGAHRLLLDRDWLEHRHLDDQRTCVEIADELNINDNTVWRALQRHRIKRPARKAALADRQWLWETHRRNDVSVERLARWLRCDSATVTCALANHDIDVRARSDDYAPGPDHLLDVDWLTERYVDDQATVQQIASQTNTTQTSVRQALRDSGITRRRDRI